VNKKVKDYVYSCIIGQQAKYITQSSPRLFQHFSISNQIWHDIDMDFITHLLLLHEYSVIMVIIVRLSKFSNFIPLLASHTTQMVANVLTQNVIKIHNIV